MYLNGSFPSYISYYNPYLIYLNLKKMPPFREEASCVVQFWAYSLPILKLLCIFDKVTSIYLSLQLPHSAVYIQLYCITSLSLYLTEK